VSSPARVLVVFYSRCGSTEKLALAAAVRAVQARANIRLRRLPDVTESPDCKADTARMKKEYVAPAEADIEWAEAISFHLPAKMDRSAPECTSFLDLVKRLKAEEKFARYNAG
jgi:NAD(P)H dehydrogenase (quinone)